MYMKDNGKTHRKMEMAQKHFTMVMFTKDSIKTVILTEKESIFGKMDLHMLVILLME